MTFQAITTKYVGPTNHKPARVIATSASGLKATISYHTEENPHRAAALALCRNFSWKGILAEGGAKDGNVYVFVNADNQIEVSN